MTDLLNTETGLVETLPQGEAENSFLSGKYALSSSKPAFVVDPETKETYEIEPSKAQDFLSRGFRFETKDEGTLRQFRNEVQEKGLSGSLKVAAKSALSEATLGVTDLAEDLTNDPMERAKKAIEEDENPVSNFIGGASGFGVSLFYGGPIAKLGTAAAKSVAKVASIGGKKAAESLISKGAQGLARGAAEGAAMAIPTGLTEAVLGDHETVGEALLAGASRIGTSAALGAAVSPIAGAIKLAGQSLSPEALKEQSRYFQLKQAGLRTPEFRRLEQATRGDLADKGIKNATKAEVYEEAGKFLDDLNYDRALSTMFKGSDDRINSIKDGFAKIGERMNNLRNTVDQIVPNALRPQNMAKEVVDINAKYNNTLGKTATTSSQDVGVMWGIIDDAFNKAAKEKGVKGLTINEAHALKQDLSEYALAAPMQFKSKGAHDMYNFWNSKIDDTLEKVKTTYGDNPALQTALKDLNADYSRLKKYEPIFNNIANREAANNRIGLTDYISAGVGGSFGDFQSAAIMGGLNYAKRNFGNQIAASSLYNAALVIDKVGGVINKALTGTLAGKAAAGIKPASVGLMGRLIEDQGGTKQEKVKQYDKIIQNVERLATDIDFSSQVYAGMTEDLSNEAPMAQAAMQATMSRAANYLKKIAPKGVQPNSVLSPQTYVPSDSQLASFERGLTAVMDPLSILEDLENGTLTKDSVAAVKEVYPKLFSEIQGKLLGAVTSTKTPLPYHVKLKIGYILETPTTQALTPDKIVMLQANYVNKEKPKPQANTKITAASRSGTEVDRVLYGQ